MKAHRLSNAGDTIVEVMIVLTILGLALSISYATANRSLLNIRQAQENSQAADLVQSQVEGLRTLSSATSPDIYLQTSGFCLNLSTTPVTIASTCTFGSLPYTILIYSCAAMPANSHCSSTGSGPETFVVEAQWDDVLGQGKDSATFTYKVHRIT